MQFTSAEGMSDDAPRHECESEIDHYTGHYVPYSLRRVCGFFNVPQIYYMCEPQFWNLSRHSWQTLTTSFLFFPFTLYFSSFTKAKAKVYNISSSSSLMSLTEVMSAQFCSVLNFFASSVEINLFQLSPPCLNRVNFLYCEILPPLLR